MSAKGKRRRIVAADKLRIVLGRLDREEEPVLALPMNLTADASVPIQVPPQYVGKNEPRHFS